MILSTFSWKRLGNPCGNPKITAIPPSGSQVAANATITLVFDYPVESVTGATEHGENWTIPVAAALNIT